MSCAIANAVLRVIETEGLQENARRVGDYLMQKCSELTNEFSIVGDVRGAGLFLGIELVKCRKTRTPATQEARWVVDQMKNVFHILVSSDGPDDNVVKLKPPMVFSQENADEFLAAFKECLKKLGQAQPEVIFLLNRI